MEFRVDISVESEVKIEGKKELDTPGRLSKDVPWKALSTVTPSVFGFLAAWIAYKIKVDNILL